MSFWRESGGLVDCNDILHTPGKCARYVYKPRIRDRLHDVFTAVVNYFKE